MKGGESAGDTGLLLDLSVTPPPHPPPCHLNQRSAPCAAILINNLAVNAGHCGIFFFLSLYLGPVCVGLLEYEVWCQEAKSASHTDLIHQGRRVLVVAALAR